MPANRSVRARRLLSAALALVLFPAAAQADVWWASTSGGAWGTPGSWSTTATDPADLVTTPTATDIVTLMNTSITQTGPITITLDGTRDAKGLAMNLSSDFITTIDGGTSNSVLNLGTSGMNLIANAVGVTIGSVTDGKKVTVNLQGTQTWSSSGTTQAIFVLNDVTLGVTGSQTLTLTGTNTGTKIDGVISDGTAGGVLNITKTNATGTWTLNGLNTYTGVTTVSTGTLTISKIANGGLPSSLGASSSAASNLLFGGGGSLTFTGPGGSTDRAFTMNGTSMALVSGTSAPTIFTNPAALNFGGTAAARTFVLRGTSTQSNAFGGLIADNDASNKTTLNKSEAGKWLLTNNANTYTGATNVIAGTLSVSMLANGGVASPIGASPDAAANLILGIDGATPTAGILQYTGAATSTSRNFTVNFNNSGFDASGTGALTLASTAAPAWGTANAARTLLLTGTNTDNNTLNALLSTNGTGLVGLTKSGAGKWVVANAANSYTGVTTINAGTLVVNALENGGVNSPLGAATDAAANLVLNGGTLQYVGTGSTSSRGFTVSSAANSTLDASGTGALVLNNTASPAWGTVNAARVLTLTGTNTNDNTLAAGLTNNGTSAVSITKTGTGKWLLTGSSTHTGTTTVSDGTLGIGNVAALGTGGVTVTNGILDIGTGIAASAGTVILNGTGSINSGAGGTLTTTGTFDLRAGTVNGVLTGASALNKTTAGTVTINSNLTTSGLVTVSAGTLAMGPSGTLGTSPVTVTAGTLDLGTDHSITTGTFTLNNAAANLTGTGTSSLSTTGTFELQNGTVNAILAGTGPVNKTSGNTVTLSGANTYTSVTTVTAGTLVGNHAQALGSTAGKTNIVNGGTLAVGNGITLGAGETVDLNGPGNGNNGGITVLTGNTGTWAGTTELSGDTPRFGAWLNASLTVTGPIVDGTSLAGQELYINGQVGAGTPGSVTIATPAGQNTFTAPIYIARGTMKLGADNTLPTTTTVNVHYSGTNNTELATFDLNGFDQTVGGLINDGGTSTTAVVTNSGAALKTLTVNNSTAMTFSGSLTGNMGFTKSGSGNYTLSSSANTYTGPTTVSTGKLLVNGDNSAVTGAVSVSALATIGGNGTIGGTTTLASSANVAPGITQTGNLTFANGLNLTAGGVYNWQLGALSTSTGFDTITVSAGNLALGGTSALTLDFGLIAATDPNSADAYWTSSRTWKIIDVTGTGTNTGDTNLSTITNASYSSGAFATSVGTGADAGDIFLVFTPGGGGGPSVWQGANNDNWTAASSWSGSVPNSTTAEAIFGGTGGNTANLNADQTVNKLTFNTTFSPHTIAGSGTLFLSGTTPTITATSVSDTNTVAVNLNLAAGTTIIVNGDGGTLQLNSPNDAVLGAGVTATVATGATLSLGGAGNALSNGTTAHANVSNSGTLVAATAGKRVGDIDGNGTTTVTATDATLTANHIRQATLNIGAGNTVTIAANGGDTGTSVLTNLSINATGKLDLTNNDLIVDNGNLTTLTAQLASGLDILGSYGNGPGITSSTFANDPNFNTVLGIASNADLGYATFSGQTIDANDVLIKYTYFGDADLNGVVDGATDFDLYITGLTSGGSLGGWLFGDFDYNGTVDSATDFDLYITGLSSQGGPLLTSGGGSNLVQAVPEPSTFVLAGLGLLGFAGARLRRRRQSA